MAGMSEGAGTEALPASPVAQQDRIPVLDCLRGLAIFGIAFVNIQFFVFPLDIVGTWNWERVSFAEGVVHAAVISFANYEFFSIFALLFGIGLAMQNRRARETGRPFALMYIRRLAVLLLLGVAHALLLWYGDILSGYALLGIVVLLCRNLSGKTLLTAACVIFLVPVVLQVLPAIKNPYNDRRQTLMDQIRTSLEANLNSQSGSDNSKGANVSPTDSSPADRKAASKTAAVQNQAAVKALLRLTDFMDDEKRIYRYGTMREKIFHRSVVFFIGSPMVAATLMGWRALAMMLLGIYIVGRGWLDGSDMHRGVYRRFVVFGLIFGIPFHLTGLIIHIIDPYTSWAVAMRSASVYLGSLGMSLAYVGLIALLCQKPNWCRRLRPLGAVGRMALTNYLGQSFLFGLVFYGYGLGWFARVGLLQAEQVVLAVLALQLLFSSFWLRYFQYGPVEWFWRVLVYR